MKPNLHCNLTNNGSHNLDRKGSRNCNINCEPKLTVLPVMTKTVNLTLHRLITFTSDQAPFYCLDREHPDLQEGDSGLGRRRLAQVIPAHKMSCIRTHELRLYTYELHLYTQHGTCSIATHTSFAHCRYGRNSSTTPQASRCRYWLTKRLPLGLRLQPLQLGVDCNANMEYGQ